MSFSFDITFRIPDHIDPLDEQRLDALHKAGCDDATFSTHGQGFMIASFTRAAEDAEIAVSSAIEAVLKIIPEASVASVERW